MHVEDSYEGAIRRMQRLEQAGLAVAPSPASSSDDDDLLARVRDLEELATLACDENERLKQELVEARDLIISLQRQVAMLESRPDPTESSFGLPEAAPPLDDGFGLDSPDDDSFSFALKRRRSGALRYVLAAALVGGIACVLLILRPPPRPQAAMAAVAPAPAVSVPSAPPIAPQPSVAKPLPAAPTPAAPSPTPSIPTAASPQPSAIETRSSHREPAKRRRSSRHHHQAARKHHATSHHVAGRHLGDTNDPLGGLEL